MLVFLRQAWRTPQPLQRELDQKPDFIMSLLVEVGSTHVKYAIWPWPKSFFVKSYVFQNVLAKECQIGQNRTAKIKKETSKSLIWFRKFIFSEQENKWFFKDVRANCFYASLLRTAAGAFTRHVMHRARAPSTKMNNDRADGHWYSFAWI